MKRHQLEVVSGGVDSAPKRDSVDLTTSMIPQELGRLFRPWADA